MKKRYSHQNKMPDKFNSKDLLSYWEELFEQYCSRDYQSAYLGHDLHVLKGLLESYGVYAVLFGLERAIKHGVTYISVLEDNFSEYLPDIPNPKVFFYLMKYPTVTAQEDYDELLSLFNKWYRTAADSERFDELNNRLNKWVDEVVV